MALEHAPARKVVLSPLLLPKAFFLPLCQNNDPEHDPAETAAEYGAVPGVPGHPWPPEGLAGLRSSFPRWGSYEI